LINVTVKKRIFELTKREEISCSGEERESICHYADAMCVTSMHVNNIWIYKIYTFTQLSIKQLLLKDISHYISQLHVSARFYGDLVFNKILSIAYNIFLKAQPEDGAIETS
jgi:hypothetical protein